MMMLMLVVIMLQTYVPSLCVYSAKDRHSYVHVAVVGNCGAVSCGLRGTRSTSNFPRACLKFASSVLSIFCLAARVPTENRSKGYAKKFREQSEPRVGFVPRRPRKMHVGASCVSTQKQHALQRARLQVDRALLKPYTPKLGFRAEGFMPDCSLVIQLIIPNLRPPLVTLKSASLKPSPRSSSVCDETL